MLQRAYNENVHKRRPTYKGCSVEEYLFNYQNFGKWYDEVYYEIPGEKMHLDKDILKKGNKVYCRKYCIFVPERINELFTKSDSIRGKYPIGVTNKNGTFLARITKTKDGIKKRVRIGSYPTPEQAFQAYKLAKESYIKEVAEEYKPLIPDKLYQALLNYQVEIDD